MYIFLLMTSCLFAADSIQDQSEINIQTFMTINATSRSIYNHLCVAQSDTNVRAAIWRELRLYKYFSHSLTPCLEETKVYHIDDTCREMFKNNHYILFRTIPLAPYQPVTCVIVGVNKLQAEDIAFKGMLYDLNMSIIKPQLKEIILSSK